MTKVDWAKYNPIFFNCVNSGIGLPEPDSTVEISSSDECVEVSGWAIGNGENGTQVNKVEISLDGGETWTEASEYVMEKRKPGRHCFSWTLWKYRLPVSKATSSNFTVMARAFTDGGESQADKTIANGYNMRGLMNCHQPEIAFTVTRK